MDSGRGRRGDCGGIKTRLQLRRQNINETKKPLTRAENTSTKTVNNRTKEKTNRNEHPMNNPL